MTSAETVTLRRDVRPWLAALASAVIPGLGQLLAQRRKRALLFLTLSALMVAGAAYMAFVQRVTLLKWTVQPDMLTWLLVGNGLVLGFRVFAAVDAFIVAGGTRPSAAGRRRR